MQRWRTILFSLASLAFLTGGLYMSLVYPTAGVAIFSSFATSVVFIVAAVAGKATAEHLSNGTGIKGVVSTLLSDAKPGEPPKAP